MLYLWSTSTYCHWKTDISSTSGKWQVAPDENGGQKHLNNKTVWVTNKVIVKLQGCSICLRRNVQIEEFCSLWSLWEQEYYQQ